MATFTLEVANTVIRVPLADSGKVTVIDLKDISPEVLAIGLVNGFVKAIGDISRGRDENDKPLTDDAWLAMRQKRVDTWLAGSWASNRQGGGSRLVTVMAEAYDAEQAAWFNVSPSVIAAKRKETVKDVLGKDAANTFSNFLDAIATKQAKAKGAEPFDTIRDALEKVWTEKALALSAERAKATPDIDLSDISLD